MVVCDQWLGSNGYAGLKALRRAGWAVSVVPEREFIPLQWRSTIARALGRALRPLAVDEFNEELQRQVIRHEPEFLLVFKGTFVKHDTLAAIRNSGVRTYCFFPDVSVHCHGKYLPHALPAYDWIFTTKRFGIRDLREQLNIKSASVLMHAYDPDVHRPAALSPSDRRRYECDVSFIGTWSPKKEALLSRLAVERPDVRLRIWGEQWNRASRRPALAGAIANHAVIGEEYVHAITASSINLGILAESRIGASSGDNITSRTFHIPASGGFMLHERTDELLEIFAEDTSVVCFDDASELIDKVDQYLPRAERRREIADCGRAIVESHHSWDHRIREILAFHDGER